MITFKGSNTTIRLTAILLRCSRTQNSNKPTSIKLSLFAMPIRSQNSRIASAVYPLLRIPLMVDILGSSQPLTCFSFTNCNNLRLLMTVYVMFKRANSYCLEGNISSCSMNQSYKARWGINSSVQTECVIFSIASLCP